MAPLKGDLPPLDAINPGERMLLPEHPLHFADSFGLPLELGLDGAVEVISDIPAEAESPGTVPDELPETHSLHLADESQPYTDSRHAREPPDVK